MLKSSTLLISKPSRRSILVKQAFNPFCLLFLLTTCFPTYSSSTQSILVFGDSVSAGYGMTPAESWPSLLATDFSRLTPPLAVINASVSGETTSGGRARLIKALEVHKPDLVILELGGNDGLRGYPIAQIEANLRAMIETSQGLNIPVILVGIVLPPNYGRRYTSAFVEIFASLAESQNLAGFLPHPLSGLETDPSLIQADGIHPTATAQPLIKNQIKPLILRWLNQ
jgi:acyl-CoA thioesterase-1